MLPLTTGARSEKDWKVWSNSAQRSLWIHGTFFFFFLRNLCKFSFLKNKNLIKKKAYGFYMTLGSGENHWKTMFNTQRVCLYNHVTANTALCLLR